MSDLEASLEGLYVLRRITIFELADAQDGVIPEGQNLVAYKLVLVDKLRHIDWLIKLIEEQLHPSAGSEISQ